MSGMDEIEFDKAFSEFLDSSAYQQADNYVFELTKAAFIAGWKAAVASEVKTAGSPDGRK